MSRVDRIWNVWETQRDRKRQTDRARKLRERENCRIPPLKSSNLHETVIGTNIGGFSWQFFFYKLSHCQICAHRHWPYFASWSWNAKYVLYLFWCEMYNMNCHIINVIMYSLIVKCNIVVCVYIFANNLFLCICACVLDNILSLLSCDMLCAYLKTIQSCKSISHLHAFMSFITTFII